MTPTEDSYIHCDYRCGWFSGAD